LAALRNKDRLDFNPNQILENMGERERRKPLQDISRIS